MLQSDVAFEAVSKVFEGKTDLIMDSANGDIECLSDLFVGHLIIAAHLEDLAALFGQGFDGLLEFVLQLVEVKLVFGLMSSDDHFLGYLSLIIPLKLLSFEKVEGVVFGCAIEVGFERGDDVDLFSFDPKIDKDILYEFFGLFGYFDHRKDEGIERVVIFLDYVFPGAAASLADLVK